jgi:hypothetical protein
MSKSTWRLMIILGIALNIFTLGCEKSAVQKRAAAPDFSERIKQDAVTGEVTGTGRNYVVIKQISGETTRVRVDDNTKMDNVMTGDKVKAYVTDDGYASTIQRTGR